MVRKKKKKTKDTKSKKQKVKTAGLHESVKEYLKPRVLSDHNDSELFTLF